MKYKLIVDKQSRTNPSKEKKEYELDIEELRVKGNIYDSLIITKDETYIIRRLFLSELHVLSVLEKPLKEPLEDLNIKLFEGDNYIYLIDLVGNKFYAEYLIKNDFNDIYVTKNEMNSTINQTAEKIEFTVNQKLTEYTTNKEIDNVVQELNSSIIQKADEITSIVSKKVGKTELCSLISQSEEEILLKGNRVVVESNKLKIDKNGNITSTGGTIGGFKLDSSKFENTINGLYNYNKYDASIVLNAFIGNLYSNTIMNNIYDMDGDGNIKPNDATRILRIVENLEVNNKKILGTFCINSSDPKNFISIKNNENLAVSIGVGGINTYMIGTQNIICSDNNKDNLSGTIITPYKITTSEIQIKNSGTVMHGSRMGHTYQCEWTGEELQFIVDGKMVKKL